MYSIRVKGSDLSIEFVVSLLTKMLLQILAAILYSVLCLGSFAVCSHLCIILTLFFVPRFFHFHKDSKPSQSFTISPEMTLTRPAPVSLRAYKLASATPFCIRQEEEDSLSSLSRYVKHETCCDQHCGDCRMKDSQCPTS